MTTAEFSDQHPRIASPEQLRTLMQDAETLLDSGTMSCEYRFHHETSLGCVCFKATEGLDEDGNNFFSAEVSIRTPATATKPGHELSNFTFYDFEETSCNQKLENPAKRETFDNSRNICVEILANGDVRDDTETAILLFLLREHAMLLDGVPNTLPFAVNGSGENMPVLRAINDLAHSHRDQITETRSYSHRRDDGDFVSIVHTKYMSGDGETQIVQTEIEFRDAKDDLYHHIVCDNEQFEEAFACTLDGKGDFAYGESEDRPYANDVEYIHEVIAAEKSEKAKVQKLQGVTSEIIRLYTEMPSSSEQLRRLVSTADTAWKDWVFSPTGSATETNAQIEYDQALASIKELFKEMYDVQPAEEYLPETIANEQELDSYIENNFVKIELEDKNYPVFADAHLYGTIPPSSIESKSVELFFINIAGVTINESSQARPYLGGTVVYGFYRFQYENHDPVLLKGYVLLKDFTSTEE